MTLINILFQTCLITNSLVQTNVNLNFIIYMNVWTAFVDGLDNKKSSFFINSYLIQDLECKNLPLFYDQNGQILLNHELQNEVSQSNFNTFKRIYNWPPFMKVVYTLSMTKMA